MLRQTVWRSAIRAFLLSDLKPPLRRKLGFLATLLSPCSGYSPPNSPKVGTEFRCGNRILLWHFQRIFLTCRRSRHARHIRHPFRPLRKIRFPFLLGKLCGFSMTITHRKNWEVLPIAIRIREGETPRTSFCLGPEVSERPNCSATA